VPRAAASSARCGQPSQLRRFVLRQRQWQCRHHIKMPSSRSSSLSLSTSVLQSCGYLVRPQLVHREEEETAAQVLPPPRRSAIASRRAAHTSAGRAAERKKEKLKGHCPKVSVIIF
jgi:hypothetical protein